MGWTAKANLYSKDIEEQDVNMRALMLSSSSGGICGKKRAEKSAQVEPGETVSQKLRRKYILSRRCPVWLMVQIRPDGCHPLVM